MARDRETGSILITRGVLDNKRLSIPPTLLFVLIACTNSTCPNLEDIHLEFITSLRVKAAYPRRVGDHQGGVTTAEEITLPHYRGTPILEIGLQQHVFCIK